MNGTTVNFGVTPLHTLRAMTGLEFLRAIRDGELPEAPIAELLGFRLIEADEGSTVFEGTPTPAYYNPVGGVHGGWYGALLDSCMACAVQSTLPAGTGYTTAEYSVSLVRPITAQTGLVRAEGRLIHGGRRMATAEGRLIDGKGRLLAHATTICMIMELPTSAE